MKSNPHQLELLFPAPSMPSAGLTVWQPWASAISIGAKRIETRSWRPPDRILGRRLCIHAAGRVPMLADCTTLEKAAIEKALGLPAAQWKQLPRSSIIGIAEVRGGLRIDRVENGAVYGSTTVGSVPRRLKIEGEELFGEYIPGRWCWLLHNAIAISPMPHVGAQGIWPVRLKKGIVPF